MNRIFFVFAFVGLFACSVQAQDISGDWQGAAGVGKARQRILLHVDKADDGGWKATLYAIDLQPDGIPVTSLTEQSSTVAFSIPDLQISYKGALNPNGTSIAGNMKWEGSAQVTFVRPTKETAWPRDIHCACSTSFVPVGHDVKLEVLDWGGTGRPIILLAGLGDTAHDFDPFAQKLVTKYHVYGITRRGTGESSSPPTTEVNYTSDRLGDDVLTVIDALHLKQRPVLVGHSIAGEELSSIGSRHPEKVAALVYLDAAYGYAFYNPAHGGLDLDALEIRKKIEHLATSEGADKRKAISDILAQLPSFEKELQLQEKTLAELPADAAVAVSSNAEVDLGPEGAILLGQRKYTKIQGPVLAIYADPHDFSKMPDPSSRAAMMKYDVGYMATYSNAFETGVPSAHVVRIPNADHYVFRSNQEQVSKEMDAFIATLPN